MAQPHFIAKYGTHCRTYGIKNYRNNRNVLLMSKWCCRRDSGEIRRYRLNLYEVVSRSVHSHWFPKSRGQGTQACAAVFSNYGWRRELSWLSLPLSFCVGHGRGQMMTRCGSPDCDAAIVALHTVADRGVHRGNQSVSVRKAMERELANGTSNLA